MQFIVLRGISGSGKSTLAAEYAKEHDHFVIVSRDAIRMALFGKWFGVDEELVTKVEHSTIREAFRAGYSVISDNTNISQRSVNKLMNIALEFTQQIAIWRCDADLETAWERCEARREATGKEIPRHVLEKQYANLQKTPHLTTPYVPTFESYKPDWSLPAVLLVDVDGTLANNVSRDIYDESKVIEDEIVKPVRQIVNSVYEDEIAVVVMSGRSEDCRADTQKWLDMHGVKYDKLVMRPSGDSRRDSVVKMELFDEYIRDQFNVIGVIDDRPQVSRQWRKYGIFTFQVGDPENDF